MNKKLSNTIKTLLAIGVLSTVGFSAIAAPIIQEVKANFKSNLTYTLNGESILEGKGGLVYEDQIYIPLRDLATALGTSVDYTNNHITLTQKDETTADNTASKATDLPEPEVCPIGYIEDTIVALDKEAQTITLGDKDDIESQIIVKVTDSTAIKHEKNKRIYTFADLEVGQKIGFISNGIMTASLPAQFEAIEITLVDESVVDDNLAICPVGYIEDTIISIDKDAKTITVGDADEIESQLIFKISDNTTFAHKVNKRLYRFEDLEVGQKVGLTPDGMMTTSIPAQLNATEVTFLD